MNKSKTVIIWLGAILSLPVAAYAFMSLIFYAWLNAAEPDRWPADRAAIWVYSSLTLTVIFLALFIFCVVVLVRNAKRNREKNAT
jgi:uncharacterized PurR-regulated membrane protein YhhQ (DUF165 family)